MQVIKLGLISVVVLFLLATAMTSLLPSTIIVSRAIDIAASPDSAYSYIKELRHWEQWLHKPDSATSIQVLSEREVAMGRTNITLTSATPSKLITIWKTGESSPLPAEFNIIRSDGAPVFTLQWAFTHKVKWYPWEKIASIVSDKAMGPFMEQSLENLKAVLEQQD